MLLLLLHVPVLKAAMVAAEEASEAVRAVRRRTLTTWLTRC